MKIKLILFEETYYLSLDSGETRQLSERNVRNFLKNYDVFCKSEEFYALPLIKANLSNGKVVACIEKNGELRILSTTLLNGVFCGDVSTYITIEEYAAKHARKRAIINRLCGQGRIEGVIQKGSSWLIPEDAPYPADARVGTRVQSTEQKIIGK